jgi:hypothetical protein
VSSTRGSVSTQHCSQTTDELGPPGSELRRWAQNDTEPDQEVRHRGTGRRTRSLGETCPDCHAFVADLDGHERCHVRMVADITTAVEKEIKRMTPATG